MLRQLWCIGSACAVVVQLLVLMGCGVGDVVRGRRAMIKTGNYPQAEALYTKAITVLPSAILFANRSLVRLNLSKPADALADANEAIGREKTDLICVCSWAVTCQVVT